MNEDFVFKIADLEQELEQSHDLVCGEYIKNNYITSKEASRKKFFSFIAAGNSTTFICKKQEKVVGTISVIGDSQNGLPMDEIYKEEIDFLRSRKRKIAEVSQLAICKQEKGRKNILILMSLFKMTLRHGIENKIDNFCIAVNPKHSVTYDLLSFENIGPLKFYPSVNNAPAIAKTLDLTRLIKEKNKLLD